MFVQRKENHTHYYDKLGFITEIGIDRVILIRSCACGSSQAFECGNRDTMRKLYILLAKETPKTVF